MPKAPRPVLLGAAGALVLAIDLGNSRIALGLAEDAAGAPRWRARWHIASDPRRTADEYALLLAALLEAEGLAPGAVGAAVLASVVPGLTPVMVEACRQGLGRAPLLLGPGVRGGMEIRYQPPTDLGADRLAGALAARARHGAPVVVVDFGTATTFNVVDAGGAFVGGAIAPGVRVAATALAQAGARLTRIELGPPGDRALPLIGRNTAASMRSGVIHGYAGLVAGLLERIDRELGAGPRPAPVVATGGMAPYIAPRVPRIGGIEPDLVLEGLWMVHRLNEAAA